MTTSIKLLEIKKLWLILKYTFGLIPIVAGADKFFNLLTQWDNYIAPWMVELLPFPTAIFMMIVGVIEISAGILVLTKTEMGAYVVSIWLVLIALSLVSTGDYLDIAVRDLALAIGAYVLAKLTEIKTEAVAH